MPKVSVIIASYNHARYLPECLDSILTQTYQDFEIIVVDDGSSDGSHELLMDYQRRYPDKIRYYWHPDHTNKGVSATCNVAIEKSQGEYLAWLGSDDLWFPEKLSKQVGFLSRHPEVGMVYSLAFVIDESGNRYPGIMGKELGQDALQQLLVSNAICASSVMIRRSCLDAVGVFNEKLAYSDWDLWIRIAAEYPIGCIPEPLVLYRIHGHNISIASQPAVKFEHNLAVIESVFSQVPEVDGSLKDRAIAYAYFGAALDYFAVGQPEAARQHVEQAARLLNASLPFQPDELTEMVVAYAVYWLPTFHGHAADRIHFLHQVFSNIAPALERKAIAKLYITDGFRSHMQGDFPGTRRHILRAILLDPSWLRNGGVLSMGAEAFLGRTVAGWLRLLAQPLKQRVGPAGSVGGVSNLVVRGN